jgi:hypothetical protein
MAKMAKQMESLISLMQDNENNEDSFIVNSD